MMGLRLHHQEVQLIIPPVWVPRLLEVPLLKSHRFGAWAKALLPAEQGPEQMIQGAPWPTEHCFGWKGWGYLLGVALHAAVLAHGGSLGPE